MSKMFEKQPCLIPALIAAVLLLDLGVVAFRFSIAARHKVIRGHVGRCKEGKKLKWKSKHNPAQRTGLNIIAWCLDGLV